MNHGDFNNGCNEAFGKFAKKKRYKAIQKNLHTSIALLRIKVFIPYVSQLISPKP